MNSFLSQKELELIGFKSLGKRVQISRNASFYGAENIIIGNDVRIDDFCVISGRVELGDYIHIAAFCGMFGGQAGIKMYDFSGLSSRVSVYAASDDYSGDALTNPTVPNRYRNVIESQVTIEKHGLVGAGSIVLPGVSISEGCSVGAMSLVTKSTEPWGIYVGVPAKRIKERSRRILELEEQFKMEESK